MFTNIPATGFLRLPQILAIFPISKSAWWEGCRTGRYPKPVKLGPRTTVW
ncbi:AlpA family phage regulatory protein, partial [Desulfovibrio sp. OttesenSCG-928-G11]|nr:AlpA family phage regulatory protein [Desulfovibrio sp. OttesenSCG-928-G11]